MRYVLVIRKEKLQLVPARQKRDFRLSLPCAEVQMIFILRDRLIKWRKLRVNY
jgi:hypothetical protein